LAFLLFVALGCWVFGRWGGLVAPRKHQLIALLVAVAISTAAGFQFLVTELASEAPKNDGELTTDVDFSEEVPWQAFSEARVAELAGQTVFVDFTADWCLTCKVNERTVLETKTVRSAMERLEVIPLKADWTRRDEEITRWLQKFGKAGVPFYLVIPADRSREMLPLPEVITPSLVVAKLEEGA
jgi:thiol:disulfide interchange protein DsbD